MLEATNKDLMADLDGAIFAYNYRIQHARTILQLEP